MNESIYIDNNGLYHHIVNLNKNNIEYYNNLIYKYLHTPLLIDGYLENEKIYHYITRIKYLQYF